MRKIAVVLFLLFSFSLALSAQTSGEVTHTVQRGETLTRIAAQYHVDVDAILIRNNLIDPNRIRAGQSLIIPTGAVTVPRTHVVGAGETLYSISIRYNTTVEALIATNNLASNTIITGQVLTLPATGGPATFPRSYMLDRGDTLRSVGVRFGVTWDAIAAYNNITTPNAVPAGLVITIPPVGWTAPVVTAPATGGPIVSQPSTPVVTAPQNITYVVQRGDVLELIAQRFGVTVASIRTYNNLSPVDAIFVGDVLIIPPTGGTNSPVVTTPRTANNGFYTVRAGDTMFAIAASFRVNVYDLAQVNGILNLNSIYAGQALQIPNR